MLEMPSTNSGDRKASRRARLIFTRYGDSASYAWMSAASRLDTTDFMMFSVVADIDADATALKPDAFCRASSNLPTLEASSETDTPVLAASASSDLR